MASEYFTGDVAARIAELSPNTVRWHLDIGDWPFIFVERRRYIPREFLEKRYGVEYVAQCLEDLEAEGVLEPWLPAPPLLGAGV
jgi:hypothetical protein